MATRYFRVGSKEDLFVGLLVSVCWVWLAHEEQDFGVGLLSPRMELKLLQEGRVQVETESRPVVWRVHLCQL